MADETGIILPWEKDAMAGLEMPDGLSYPDQILYISLRMLYRQYYQKTIDRDTATKEKVELLRTYEAHKIVERMGREWVDQIKRTELARATYRKERTLENADRLIECVEGKRFNAKVQATD